MSTTGVAPETVMVSCDVADAELDVDVGREAAAQLDTFAQDRAEAGQGEGDVVAAYFQRDDQVLAVAVGDGAAHPFDQRVAARLHRHAGQHPARGVCNRAANLLRAGDTGNEQQHGQD